MPYSNNPIFPLLKQTDLLLFHSNPLPCFIIDKQTLAICHQNSAAEDQYPQVIAGETRQSFLSLFNENSALKLKHKIGTAVTGSSWTETIIEQQEGLPLIAIELSANALTLESREYYLVICVDVSERQAEVLRLKAEKHKYRVFIKQSSEGIYCIEFVNPIPVDATPDLLLELFQKDGILSECNDAMARMYGFEKASDIIGISASHLIDLTDENNIAYLNSIVSNGFNITNAESQEKDNQGQSRYFLNNVVGIVEGGYLKRIWGTQRDITERKENEEKIKFLASLVEETSDVLTAADLDFNPVTWNAASEKVYGLTREQVIGKSIRSSINLCYKGATREEIRATICEQGEWKGEMNFVRPTDNKFITLLVTFKLLKNDRGIAIGHVVAGTDITERIETEQRLSESEGRFGHIADAAPVMIWMSDTEDKISYINQQMTDYTGIGKEAISFFSPTSIIHPDDHESTGHRYKQYFEKREPITLVYRLRNASGDYRWVQDSSIPRLLGDGTFLGYVGCIIDIHDTKSGEEALRYQATILENVLDILVTTDLNLRVISWNKVAEEVYGYTEREALDRHFTEVIRIDTVSSPLEEIKRSLKESGIWKGEVVYKSKEGDKRYFVHTVTHVFDNSGNKIGVMTVGRDITDRIHAERKLKESEQFYRSLIADSHDGMFLMNAEGMITFASPSIKSILGFEPEDVTGRSGFDFVHPADYGLAFQSFEREVTVTTELKYLSIRLLKKDGGWVWCSVRGFNMLENPSVNSIVAYFHDDTLRKTATEALRASELRFRNLIRDIQIGVILYDPAGKVILCNKFIADIHQTTEEELVAKDIYEVITDVYHEDGRKFTREERPLYRALTLREPVKDVVMGVKLVHNTAIVWLLVNTDPILDEAGNIIHIISSLKDITERKILEESLRNEQLNRQKALTQATIDGQEKERREIGKELHDNIGQQLTTTKLYLDLASSSSDDASGEMVKLALKSVKDVINEVRGISRALVPQTLGDLGLKDSIDDLVDTIRRTLPLQIEIISDEFAEERTPDNQKLMIFRILQEQLNNIVKHAKATKVRISLRNYGALVLLIVDNGQGFDPLRTSKSLGLTNIRNRAELFGGRVEIVSAPGSGCSVKVIIPHLPVPALTN